MSEATADQRSRADFDEIIARTRRQQAESDKLVEEGRKLIAEARKLEAEERKLRRDAAFAPLVAAAAAGAGFLAILQLLFRAAGWLP